MTMHTHEQLSRNSKFLCSSEDFTQSSSVIMGLPMDSTTSFRPGARFGPARIREAAFLEGIEEYSIYQDKSLEDLLFYDAGDVNITHGNVQKSLEDSYQIAKSLLAHNKKLFSLGGEHLVSLPLVKAYQEKYPDLALIQFDAHADLRDEYLGEKLSHATVIRRISELLQPKSVFQLGIRSGAEAEFVFAKTATHLYVDRVLPVIPEVKQKIGTRPVYITVDIDVLDPAFAPGTGTPEAGGISSGELLKALLSLADLNIIGFDLVEISPQLDPGGNTVVLGAKLLREALLAYS